jgi:hypothetical protein
VRSKRSEFLLDVPTKYTKGGTVYDKAVKNEIPRVGVWRVLNG